MDTRKYTCVDCGTTACDSKDGAYPPFCLTENMDEEVLEKALDAYSEKDREVMKAAARVEYEGYLKWPRVQEIMEFAKKMDFQKIGIATCVGLIREAGIFAEILRSQGFEVFSVVCKAGAVPKTDMGIDEECNAVGKNMCNPVLQATMMNEEGTDLNVVVGLCVGHDSLFYKHSDAYVTTLVTKDRVTGHNPAAALYTAHSYYKRLKK